MIHDNNQRIKIEFQQVKSCFARGRSLIIDSYYILALFIFGKQILKVQLKLGCSNTDESMSAWIPRKKVVIVGNQACGKTCLYIVFKTERFPNV